MVAAESLERNPFFKALRPEAREALKPLSHRHSYRAGETIFCEGKETGPLRVLVKGLVSFRQSQPEADSDALMGSVARSGDIFGISALGMQPPPEAVEKFGVFQSVSIPKLFIAGVFPGLVFAGSILVMNYIVCKRRGTRAPPKVSRFETSFAPSTRASGRCWRRSLSWAAGGRRRRPGGHRRRPRRRPVPGPRRSGRASL